MYARNEVQYFQFAGFIKTTPKLYLPSVIYECAICYETNDKYICGTLYLNSELFSALVVSKNRGTGGE